MATKDLGQVVGPAGPKGDTGSQGIQGPTGPAGPKGDTGSTGPAGSQGPKGDTGAKGDTGDPGPGVATGGAAGQFLKKHSGTNYDTEWETLTGAGIPVSGSDATKISASLENLSGGIAIVSVGNTHVAISQEQYVYVREHGTLSEGLYKALSNIAANATLSTSNLSAVSGGLGAEVSSLNSKIANQYIKNSNDWVGSLSVTLPKPGAYLFVSQRYAQIEILSRFNNGDTAHTNVAGNNWTFTNGTGGVITASATNIADYYIISLILI